MSSHYRAEHRTIDIGAGELLTIYPAPTRVARARATTEAWMERAEIIDNPPSPDWPIHAACLGLPASLMFPPPLRGAANDAVRICRTWCPVTLSCLRAAGQTEHHEHPSLIFGVRGGLTAQQRGIAYKRARSRRRLEVSA